MSSTKHKLRLAGALAVLATLALAISCRGFFVNPTLTSISVGPSGQTIVPGASLQMIATGTFDDGSTANVTGKCLWTSSDTSVATVGQSNGKVLAASVINNPPGTTTITAVDGTASNTATVTVCPNVTAMTLTANTTSPKENDLVTFTAMASFGGLPQTDVTNEVTWNISNTAVFSSITGGQGTVLAGSSGQSTNVSATLCGFTSQALTIHVQ
ncbi:MAG: Ig-like domain-containing protein [Acidobacteriia bacterium]|nr:Ig-like domain-containing protein [Terriglobia bacterium]